MWRSIGPNNVSGRVTDLVVGPGNGDEVYAATETGGVWHTTDGGRMWRPMMLHEPCLATSAVAVYFSGAPAERVVYAGTGVSMGMNLDRRDGALHLFSGLGLLVRREDGAGWVHKPSIGVPYVNRIHVDPRRSSRIYVATNAGMKLSNNGGDIWVTLTTGDMVNPLAGEIADSLPDPSDPDTLYAVAHDGGVYRIAFTGGVTSTAHSAVRLGARTFSWARLAVGRRSTDGRQLILVKEVTGVLHRSIDAGMTWTDSRPPLASGSNRSHNAIAVAPDDEDVVHLGAVNHTYTTNGGQRWDPSPINGSDYWRFAFAPATSSVVYAAYDQGISRSADGGRSWEPATFGLANLQFYKIGNWRQLGSVIGGGPQDLQAHFTTGGLNWRNHASGWPDAGAFVVHPDDPRIRYTTDNDMAPIDPMVRALGVRGIYKTLDGGRSIMHVPRDFDFTDPVNFERLPALATLTMDPVDPEKLFTTANSVYVNHDGGRSGWAKVSQIPVVADSDHMVQVLVIAASDTNYVYAGVGGRGPLSTAGGGPVLRSTNGGSRSTAGTIVPWDDITRNLPGRPAPERPVTGMAVDPANPRRVLVSIGATSPSGTPPASVYLCEDTDLLLRDPANSANDWQLRSTGLPNRTVQTVAIHPRQPNTFFAGTDVGVYRSLDAGMNWAPFIDGLPRVPVTQLLFDTHRPTATYLYAGTYGRGAYKIDLDATAPPRAVELFLRDNLLDTGEEYPSPSGLPNPLAPGENVYFWESPDVVFDAPPYLTLRPGPMRSIEFDRLVHENPRRGVSNRLYVQVHNRGTAVASDVTLTAFVTSACGALPPFPRALLGGGTDPNWRRVDQVSGITVEPNSSTIVRIDTRSDLFDRLPDTPPDMFDRLPGHTCLVAFVTSPTDPIPTMGGPLNEFIPNTRHATQKNLEVVNADDTIIGCPMMLQIHNADDEADEAGVDLVVEPSTTGKGVLYMMTSPLVAAIAPAKQDGVDVIAVRSADDLMALGLGPAGLVAPDQWGKLDAGVVYRLDPNVRTVLRGLRLARGRPIGVYVNYVNKYNLTRSDRPFTFKLLQVQNGKVVGGLTYETRPPEDRPNAPRRFVRLRFTVESVTIYDDLDPWIKGRGEFVFRSILAAGADRRTYRSHHPQEGVIRISDREGLNKRAFDWTVFDGFLAADEPVSWTLAATERDMFDPDDELPQHTMTRRAEAWIGRYEIGRDVLKDWAIRFRVDRID